MDIIQRLARNVVKTKYSDLPKEAIETAKLAILDTLACIIAGANAPGCDLIRNQIVEWGGKRESTIMIFGDKVPCPNAALVTSTMARALDFDTTWARGVHMSAASVPAALAVAEMCEGVSGKQFLTALITGEDLAARVHLAIPDYGGFDPTGVCGILGIAAITGKILRLNEYQIIDALSIAFNRASGSVQPAIDGALVFRVMQGFTSRSGIESALLAQRGITGGENTLQGPYGYFHLFSSDKYDDEIITDKIGKEFKGALETQIKQYPSCGGTASAIEATIQIVTENKIMPDDVEEIIVYSNRFFHNMNGKKFKIGAHPQVDAQFSFPYTVANAIVRRRFNIQDISLEAINNKEVLQIAKKVCSRVNDDLEKESFRATIVEILTKGGRNYSRQVNHPRGSKENRMSRQEIVEKFMSCTDCSEKPLPKGNAEQIIKAIDEMEKIGDISELIRLTTEHVRNQ